jgi:hypothetical protein
MAVSLGPPNHITAFSKCCPGLLRRIELHTPRKLGLEGIVSKKLNAPYKSGPSKAWLKIKNPKASAATRVIDGAF